MPIYDVQCRRCGREYVDVFCHINETYRCECGGRTKRLMTINGPNCINEDAGWIKTVCEVVDKDGGAHCQEFLRNPTRANYKTWMRGEGIRPMEPGEEKVRRSEPDMSRLKKSMLTEMVRRRRIEVG